MPSIPSVLQAPPLHVSPYLIPHISSCRIHDVTIRVHLFFRPMNFLTNLEIAATRRRSARIAPDKVSSSLAETPNTSEPTVNGDDASSSDFPEPFMIGQYISKKGEGKADTSRDSLSSVATSNRSNDSSGYSTPATSAVATPVLTESTSATSIIPLRRGRRRAAASTMESSTRSINPVARAAALRNSKFSLNPSSSKRKRSVTSDNEDAEEDNTPDALLARALQEKEDAVASMMIGTSGSYPQSSPRKAMKILPETDFAMDLSDDDLDVPVAFSSRPFKKPKFELGSQGSNEIKFTLGEKSFKSNSMMVLDSDDSDGFVEIDDSEYSDYSDDAHMSNSRSQMKKIVQGQSKAFRAETLPPRRSGFKVPALPVRDTKPSTSAFGARSFSKPELKKEDTKTSVGSRLISTSLRPHDIPSTDSEFGSELGTMNNSDSSDFYPSDSDALAVPPVAGPSRIPSRRGARQRINILEHRHTRRARQDRARLELHHPELNTMWQDLENLPKIGNVKIEQPTSINRELKPFQLEGVAWMKAMEATEWGGGLLGDEMGMGKTIQAVSLIMSDFPATQPSLVLVPPVALMQWQQEIANYTDGTLKTFVYHGTNAQTKDVTLKELKKFNVILMSYNSLESMYRKQEKGFKRKNGIHKEKSVIHQIHFHRVILDEAHNIKVSSSSDLVGSSLTIF